MQGRGFKVKKGEREDKELGNDEERRCEEVDAGQLDPQGGPSIHSSAFWDLESLCCDNSEGSAGVDGFMVD